MTKRPGGQVFNSLYTKLVGVLLFVCLAMATMFAGILHKSHDTYHSELSQSTNRDLAKQLVAEKILLAKGGADEIALNAIFNRLTLINPHIAVHLLDEQGRVLASSSPPEQIKQQTVNVLPLQRVLQGEGQLPILGDDPLEPARQKIFSVAEIPGPERPRGYLYVILRGEEHEREAQQLKHSYAFQQGIWLLASCAMFALLAGLLMVNFLTWPLRRLTAAMDQFQDHGFHTQPRFDEIPLPSSRDEIGRLAETFRGMADRIVEQVAQLKKNDAARRELLANISHDLRTPLTSLLGYLETVSTREQALAPEEIKSYCEIAASEARHLSKLVDRLFELAKLDAPEARIAPEPFMLSELSQAVIRKFSLAAKEQEVILTCNIPEGLPPVNGDIGLIQRVMENLLENALQYTPSNGTVRLQAVSDQDAVMVQVSDTGAGIAPENLPHIFERFYRGERDRGIESGHAGLGLAIVKRILELHGCPISVDSGPGAGTTFSFRLPVARPTEQKTGMSP
jgi:two-component system, OmpR family, sensor kinase